MYFLDTCVCVEFLRGGLQLGYQMMRESDPTNFRLPSLVVAELWYGAEHSDNPAKNLGVVGEFVGAFEVAPFDSESAREYGRLRQLLSSQGCLIGDRDLMIAACTLANRAVLVTNNIKEFKRIPELAIESWHEVDA